MAISRTATSLTSSTALRRQVTWAEPLAETSAARRAARGGAQTFAVLRGKRPPFQEFQWHAADLNRVNSRHIAQTTRHLSESLARAEKTETVSFFDEAAALVGKSASDD